MDVEGGGQPLFDSSNGNVAVANGEIYNYANLKTLLRKEHPWKTKSDCEVLLYLYEEFGPDFVKMLNGIFAFAIYSPATKDYIIARDHLGVCPLYAGWDDECLMYVSSEMKSLLGICKGVIEFPPGCYFLGSERKFVRWYKPFWAEVFPTGKLSLEKLRQGLEQAVERQLMSDVPCGVLLSGGLDSSLVAAIAVKHARSRNIPLHSFSIGLEDSPDLMFARRTAKFLGTEHHEIIFTIQEGLDALKSVIYHTETFDVTTIRASTPMFLMARKIRSSGVKVVLSGEGSDEIFGGYLYFHMAPDAREFHEETVRKLFLLSKYDCLRANKSTAAWGIEIRVPFLDKEFMDYAMSFDPVDKMCSGKEIEKRVLREAFEGYLPVEILWRQKEQFSDGVGYSWIDHLKKYAEENVTDDLFARAQTFFPVGTPASKEAFLYRSIFETLFPNVSAADTVPVGPSIACSTPAALRWSKEFQGLDDPSGRTIKSVHATPSQL